MLALLKTGGRHLGGKSLVFGANKSGKYTIEPSLMTQLDYFCISIRLLDVYVVLWLLLTVIKFFQIFACGNISLQIYLCVTTLL